MDGEPGDTVDATTPRGTAPDNPPAVLQKVIRRRVPLIRATSDNGPLTSSRAACFSPRLGGQGIRAPRGCRLARAECQVTAPCHAVGHSVAETTGGTQIGYSGALAWVV